MLEIHRDVVASNVGCHGYNGGSIELSDQMASRNAIEVGHNDVHQHQIVL
jgi:hypothetical protein